MMNKNNLADTNPKGIFPNIQYGLSNLFAVMLIGLIAVSIHTYFLFEKINGTLEQLSLFSIVIYFIGLIGFFKAMRILTIYSVETNYAKDVNEWSNAKFKAYDPDLEDLLSISSIQDKIVGDKSEDLQMVNLFSEILKEANEERFVTSAVVTQSYRENASSKIFDVVNFQKISLQLGILGTFIGLVLAFVNLNFDNPKETLPYISNALQFSFHTSIAGLVSSILLAFTLQKIRKKQEVFFHFMEKATNSLIRLVRQPYIEKNIRFELNNASKNIEKLINSIKILSQRIETQQEIMTNGFVHLEKSKDDLKEFLANMKKDYSDFILKMENVYNILSPETISDNLKINLEKAVSGVSEALNSNLTKTIENYKPLFAALTRMKELLEEQSNHIKNGNLQVDITKKEMLEFQKQFIEQLTASHVSKQLLNSVSEVGNKLSSNINTNVSNLTSNISRFEHQLSKFNSFVIDKYEGNKRKIKLTLIISSIFGITGFILLLLAILFPDEFANFF